MMVSIAGWSGTIIYLATYSLVALGLLEAGSIYLGFNIVAAAMIMVAAAAKGTWAVFSLNFTWAVISLRACVASPLSLPLFSLSLSRWSLLTFFLIAMSLFSLGRPAQVLEALAWCFFLGYVVAYLLSLSKRIGLMEFQSRNLFAATIIIPSLWAAQSWAFVTIQVFWLAISLMGLFQNTINQWSSRALVNPPTSIRKKIREQQVNTLPFCP